MEEKFKIILWTFISGFVLFKCCYTPPYKPNMQWWEDYQDYFKAPIFVYSYQELETEEGGVTTGKTLSTCHLEAYKLKEDRGFYNREQVIEKLPVIHNGKKVDLNIKTFFGKSNSEQLYYTNWLSVSELNEQLFNPYRFKLDKVIPTTYYDKPVANTHQSENTYERLIACHNTLKQNDFVDEPDRSFKPVQWYPTIKNSLFGSNEDKLSKLRTRLADITLRKDTLFKMHTSCHGYTQIEFINAKEGLVYFFTLYTGMPSPICGDVSYRIGEGWLDENDIYLESAEQFSEQIPRL